MSILYREGSRLEISGDRGSENFSTIIGNRSLAVRRIINDTLKTGLAGLIISRMKF